MKKNLLSLEEKNVLNKKIISDVKNSKVDGNERKSKGNSKKRKKAKAKVRERTKKEDELVVPNERKKRKKVG